MKYLLDTPTFIWSIAQSDLIPERTRQKLRNPEDDVFISADGQEVMAAGG